ncbi:cation:proton antiporter [Fretibacterium sp. OH1220_COT-178]|nr:cation:proton antiporter [Fretibacterium sp. OH1220_COT-178]
MTEGLIVNHYEAVAVILSGIGLTNLLLQRNLIKKIIGLNIMDTAVYLFLAAKGYVAGRAAPIIQNGVTAAEAYVNPIPSVTAFALSLTLRLYEAYGTLNIDEAFARMRAERRREEGRS